VVSWKSAPRSPGASEEGAAPGLGEARVAEAMEEAHFGVRRGWLAGPCECAEYTYAGRVIRSRGGYNVAGRRYRSYQAR